MELRPPVSVVEEPKPLKRHDAHARTHAVALVLDQLCFVEGSEVAGGKRPRGALDLKVGAEQAVGMVGAVALFTVLVTGFSIVRETELRWVALVSALLGGVVGAWILMRGGF